MKIKMPPWNILFHKKLGVSLKKCWEMIEKTINFYEKLEKKDKWLGEIFSSFSYFPWKIIATRHPRSFIPWKTQNIIEHFTKLLISFSDSSYKLADFQSFSNIFINTP